MKRKIPVWAYLGGGVLLLFAIGTWILCFRTTPFRISRQTTYLTEPLTADGGRVDYDKAWREKYGSPNESTDRNGYRLLVRTFGDRIHQTEPERRKKTLEQLGLDPALRPTHDWPDPYKFLLDYATGRSEDPAPYFQAVERSWTPETLLLMREWMEENEGAVDLIADAVGQPEFRIPEPREEEGLSVPSVAENQFQRSLARLFRIRAHYHMATGDIEEAMKDALTIHRMGRHWGRKGTLIGFLVETSVEELAHEIDFFADPARQPTPEQRERFLAEFQSLPPRISFEELMESERLLMLHLAQEAAFEKKNGAAHFDVPEWAANLPYDWNVVCRRINESYDAAIAGEDLSPYARSSRFYHWITVRGRSRQLGNLSTLPEQIRRFCQRLEDGDERLKQRLRPTDTDEDHTE